MRHHDWNMLFAIWSYGTKFVAGAVFLAGLIAIDRYRWRRNV